MVRNSVSRTNQNGPEAYGFRGNGQNLDLNRDCIKQDSKNARAFAKQDFLYKDRHWEQHTFPKFCKAVVGNGFWKQMSQMLADMVKIKMFQTTESSTMKEYEYCDYFSIRHPIRLVSVLLAIFMLYLMFLQFFLKSATIWLKSCSFSCSASCKVMAAIPARPLVFGISTP